MSSLPRHRSCPVAPATVATNSARTNDRPVATVEDATIARAGRVVLRDVVLHVFPGEVVGLVGPNASGKTTLIYALLGYLHVSSGCILIAGHDPSREWAAVARHLSVVVDEPGLPDALSVGEYLTFCAAMQSLRGASAASAVGEALKRLDILQYRQMRGAELSKGTRQRVAIARAFLNRPSLVLLDEPFDGLDVDVKHSISMALRAHATDAGAVLLTSHDLHELERICDRVVLIENQRVVPLIEGDARARSAHLELIVRYSHPSLDPDAVALRDRGAHWNADECSWTLRLDETDMDVRAAVQYVLSLPGDIIYLRVGSATLEHAYLSALRRSTTP